MEIPVGITGRILDGEYAGWEIEVMYDAEGTGGYYVFLTHGEGGLRRLGGGLRQCPRLLRGSELAYRLGTRRLATASMTDLGVLLVPVSVSGDGTDRGGTVRLEA
ncbi:MAG: hypothetical protein E7Z94_07470 [Actinomyces ruminicola]|nr:hypothetical protein [Actinomyces ruminicola]